MVQQKDENPIRAIKYSFERHSGYIVSPQTTTQTLLALGHTASLDPWADPQVHAHTASEEYYILLQGELNFLVANTTLTLLPKEILMIKPEIPHAIIGGTGLIEHFGLRAPALHDKQVLSELPPTLPGEAYAEREVNADRGYRIPLASPKNHNCWLIGAGSALFKSHHLIMAYLNFPTPETANAGLGTRHRLHYHQRSWEYYIVLKGIKTLQVEDELVTIRAGEMLEVPPQVKHTLYSREAPYEGLTLRVPVDLHDKVEF